MSRTRIAAIVIGIPIAAGAIFLVVIGLTADLLSVYPQIGFAGICTAAVFSTGWALTADGVRRVTPRLSRLNFQKLPRVFRYETAAGVVSIITSIALSVCLLLTQSSEPSKSRPTTLFEDFNSGEISPAKWDINDPRGLMSATEGGLQANVPLGMPYAEGTLTAKPPKQVTYVEFDAEILATQPPSKGSFYVILIGTNGQRRIAIAPYSNQPNRQGFEAESCFDQRCDKVDDIGDNQLTTGDPHTMSIAADQDATRFSISGFPPLAGPPIGDVKEVRLYVSTDTNASMKVKVDNIKFGYLD